MKNITVDLTSEDLQNILHALEFALGEGYLADSATLNLEARLEELKNDMS